jgi:hypothetical protein
MKKYLLLLNLLLLTSGVVLGDTPVVVPSDRPAKVIQDAKTKVVYYLESDRRHIAAVSPDGKLLWCCEVIPALKAKSMYIANFGFRSVNGEDCVSVSIWRSGYGGGTINEKTGVYTDSGIVL